MHTVEIDGSKPPVGTYSMRIGDIAVVESGVNQFNQLVGQIVIRTISGIFSLTNPHNTWNEPSDGWPDFRVRILPAGTKITITVGE